MIMDILPLWAWLLFYVLVFIMLIADLKMFGKKGEHEVSIKEALKMTFVWIGVSLVFCAGIYFLYPVEPHEKAMEFLAGYLIEKSLSMDNLFVFLMLFSFFGVERKYQHEVLFWGIFGALVLRSIFIFAGAAMVEQFEWVLGLFGLFLLSCSIQVVRCSAITTNSRATHRRTSSYDCSRSSSPSPIRCTVRNSLSGKK